MKTTRNLFNSALRNPAVIIVAFAVLVAAILRFWNLTNTMMFLGDQGRDALIVADIFRNKDLVFIGPVTSVGNMYLGPFYYYFMLPWLFLSYPSPVGPAYVVALLGVVTVALYYFLGKDLVGKRAAIITTILATFSWISIQYSRFSWNPNLAPLISLIALWSVWKSWKDSNPRYWVLATAMVALLLQLHYVTLLLLPPLGIIWLIQVYSARAKREKLIKLFSWSMISALVLLLSFIPLTLFDWKHDWLNAQALNNMFFGSDSFGKVQDPLIKRLTAIIFETHGRGMHVLFENWIGPHRTINTLLLVLSVLGSFLLLKFNRGKTDKKGLGLLVLTMGLSILGLSAYSSSVFDHYILFLVPVTLLLFGAFIDSLMKIPKVGMVVGLSAILLFIGLNINLYSYGNSGLNIDFIQKTTKFIPQIIDNNEPYGIVLLSASRDLYGMNYRYYLSTMDGYRPVSPENIGLAKKLIVINEEKIAEDPLSLPIYELVTFSENASLLQKYDLPHGPELYVLAKEQAE